MEVDALEALRIEPLEEFDLILPRVTQVADDK